MSPGKAPDISKLQAKRNIKKLIKALSYQGDPYVRANAARALGEIGDPQAIGPLIAVLNDGAYKVCRLAAEALGKFGDPQAVDPLIAALDHVDNQVREAAAKALGKIEAPGTEEALVPALEDEDADVRKAAADVLQKFCWQPDSETDSLNYWIAQSDWDRCVKVGSEAVPLLISKLSDESESVREGAAEALGKIGDPQAINPLMTEVSQNASLGAAEALGKIGDPVVVEPLISAAINRYNKEKWNATMTTLEKIGEPAVQPLLDLFKNEDVEINNAAATALGRIGHPSAVTAMIAALRNKNSDVRYNAAYVLGKIGDIRAAKPLIKALKDKSQDVRDGAARALKGLGTPVINFLVAALKDKNQKTREGVAKLLDELDWKPGQDANGAAYWVVRKNWQKCIRIGSQAVEPLIAALASDEILSRLDVIKALGKIGDARAVEPLIKCFVLDKETEIRKSAASALVNLYQSGQLDEKQKKSVLEKRENMINNHTDHFQDHMDSGSRNCHADQTTHTDRDISVDFPL